MSISEIASTVQEIQELIRMQEELSTEIEALKDKVKSYMSTQNVVSITAGAWKVTYQEITSSRIDTTALKKELPDVAAQYTKTSTSKRFLIK